MSVSSIIHLVCNDEVDVTLSRWTEELHVRCSLCGNVLDNSQLCSAVHGVDSGVCLVPSFASMIGSCQVNFVSNHYRIPGHTTICSNGLKETATCLAKNFY